MAGTVIWQQAYTAYMRGLTVTIAASALSTLCAASPYSYQELPGPASLSNWQVHGISAGGTVLGSNSAGPVLSDASGCTTLPLGSFTYAEPYGMSASGLAVGLGYSAGSTKAIAWDSGGNPHSIGDMGGNSCAFGVKDDGSEIVGGCDVVINGSSVEQAAVFDQTGPHLLANPGDPLGPYGAYGYGMDGSIYGYSTNAGHSRATVWRNGVGIQIAANPQILPESFALGVDAQGNIAIQSILNNNPAPPCRTGILSGGIYTDFGSFGYSFIQVQGITASGMAFGVAQNGAQSYKGFAWTRSTGLQTINFVAGVDESVFLNPSAVNTNGQIAVVSLPTGFGRLNPVPEPTSIAAMLAGICLLRRRRR